MLSDVSLRFAAGSKVALCGRTGSGKSSLLSALSRLYPIDSGAIIVDGIDWCRAPLRFARQSVRVVAQDALLLDGTLLSNLLAFAAEERRLNTRRPLELTLSLPNKSEC